MKAIALVLCAAAALSLSAAGAAAVIGPNGAAVRGPNGAAAVRGPGGATAVRGPNGAVATARPAYGAATGRGFYYGGRAYHGIYAAPFVYPHGWAYRRWVVGAVLPPLFLTSTYYYTGYAALGLPPAPAECQWVRYGPDLLLVNVHTGAVVHIAYGVFE